MSLSSRSSLGVESAATGHFLRALHGALPTTCVLEPHGPRGAARVRRARGGGLPQEPPADEVIQSGDGLEADCLAKVALPDGFDWSVAASGTGVYFVAEAETEQEVPIRAALTQTTRRRASLLNTHLPSTSSTTNSAEHYPDGSTHYMLGEADGTLNRTVPVQKLLQLERLLCFLTGRAR